MSGDNIFILVLLFIFMFFLYFTIKEIIKSDYHARDVLEDLRESWKEQDENMQWTWKNYYIPDDTEVIAELKRFSKRQRRKFATKRRRNHNL